MYAKHKNLFEINMIQPTRNFNLIDNILNKKKIEAKKELESYQNKDKINKRTSSKSSNFFRDNYTLSDLDKFSSQISKKNMLIKSGSNQLYNNDLKKNVVNLNSNLINNLNSELEEFKEITDNQKEIKRNKISLIHFDNQQIQKCRKENHNPETILNLFLTSTNPLKKKSLINIYPQLIEKRKAETSKIPFIIKCMDKKYKTFYHNQINFDKEYVHRYRKQKVNLEDVLENHNRNDRKGISSERVPGINAYNKYMSVLNDLDSANPEIKKKLIDMFENGDEINFNKKINSHNGKNKKYKNNNNRNYNKDFLPSVSNKNQMETHTSGSNNDTEKEYMKDIININSDNYTNNTIKNN